eukprot:363892-Chlamydomonas_euryale.AAC.1
MTAQRIDEKCEEFLSTHFNIKIDFKIDDALERLLSWGLVDVKTTNKSKLYMAKPLDEVRLPVRRLPHASACATGVGPLCRNALQASVRCAETCYRRWSAVQKRATGIGSLCRRPCRPRWQSWQQFACATCFLGAASRALAMSWAMVPEADPHLNGFSRTFE